MDLLHILSLVIIILTYFQSGWALCGKGTFINLCGKCIESNGRFTEGMDKCGVCGGGDGCVGCDGVINSGLTIDLCGQCLLINDNKWNDCLRVSSVYPSLVDQALNMNIIVLSVSGAGLSADNPALHDPVCHISPADNQTERPTILETSTEEADLELKVQLGAALGKFEVICDGVEGKAEFIIANSKAWNTEAVTPRLLHVDETYQLKLSVSGALAGEGPVFCFMRCAGLPTRVEAGQWENRGSVTCHDVTPRLASNCTVGAAATHDAAYDEDSTGTAVSLNIAVAAPYVLTVDLSADMSKILVRFNSNIQMTQPCSQIFSAVSATSLDTSRCVVSGDVLEVALDSIRPLPPYIEINRGNGVRRMGSPHPILAPECSPVTVPVSVIKVLPPNLSLQVPSVVCVMRSEELAVSSIGEQRLRYEWIVSPPAVRPGTQRQNLMLWEKVRKLESSLNAGGERLKPHLNIAELRENASYRINVRGTNALGGEQLVSSALMFSPSAPVSVTVSAPPAVTAILAEVNLTVCAHITGPFIFRWFLNGELVHGSGRVILMAKLNPGQYNITCVVSQYSTGEVLAEGWVVTQVLPSDEKALLSPAEQVVGTMDPVSISVFGPYSAPGLWRCATPDSYPCLSPGPDEQRIEQLIVNNVTTLTVAAGLLPVGRYVWTVENMASTEAVVVVRAGLPPFVRAAPVPPLVNPLLPLELKGEARRLRTDCTLRWSTVFRLGFNYFNLQEDVGLGDPLLIEPGFDSFAELPLVLPPAQSNWTGLMMESSYLLRFSANCPTPAGSGHVDVPITVNVPPTVTPIVVEPTDGVALVSEFVVSGGSAHDVFNDYPLEYVWSVRVGDSQFLVDFGGSSRDIRIRLPPGQVTVVLQVCDLHVTCTAVKSSPVSVLVPPSVSYDFIGSLCNEIHELVLEGSTVAGLGKAVVAVKTLELVRSPQRLMQLQMLTNTADDAIATRCRDLTIEMETNTSAAVTSLEFLRLVLEYLKYLKTSQITRDLIVELKDSVTAKASLRFTRAVLGVSGVVIGDGGTVERLQVNKISRKKRNKRRSVLNRQSGMATVMETAILTSEEMYARDPTELNGGKLLDEVKITMARLCDGHSDNRRIETKLGTTLWVSSSLTKADFTKYLPTLPNIKIRLGERRPSPTCLTVASFSSKIFADNNLTFVNQVYEVETVFNKSGVMQVLPRTTAMDPMIDIKFEIPSDNENVNCAVWANGKWSVLEMKEVKNSDVICKTRDFGYFAVVKMGDSKTPLTTPSTTMSTSTATTNSTTEGATITSTITTTETSTTVTTTDIASAESTTSPTIATSTTTAMPENTVIKPEIVIRTEKISYGGVQFTLEEDYNGTVAGRLPDFESEIQRQVAVTLKVEPKDIVVTASPGSIVVTVYMLVSLQEDRARSVVAKLTQLIEDGKLQLTSRGAPLNLPKQNVTLIQSDDSNQAAVIQNATGAVIGVVIVVVIWILYKTGRRKPKDDFLTRSLEVEDDLPRYLNFDNDPSLDGSEMSLQKYRRPCTLAVDSLVSPAE